MNEWWLISSFIFLAVLALVFALYPLRRSKLLLALVGPILIIALTMAYWRWGSWDVWQNYVQQQGVKQQIEAIAKTIKSPGELVDKMKARLAEEPENPRGWYLLGRLYASQGQWPEARDAFFKAHQLSSDEVQITVNYVQSLVQVNHGEFNEPARELLKGVLLKDPKQPDAMAMLAIDAYNKTDYPLAISYWQQLLQLAPVQSEEAQMLRKAIAKAQRRLAE